MHDVAYALYICVMSPIMFSSTMLMPDVIHHVECHSSCMNDNLCMMSFIMHDDIHNLCMMTFIIHDDIHNVCMVRFIKHHAWHHA